MPTWLLYCVFRRFLPRSHPWRDLITLEDWRLKETALCKDFDDTFRIIGLAIVVFTLAYIFSFALGL